MDSNLDKYLAFIKTAEYGSISKSAESLNYSQSAVSKMIMDLEKDLGISLFKRVKYGVALTDDAKQILPYAQNMISEYIGLNKKVFEIKKSKK